VCAIVNDATFGPVGSRTQTASAFAAQSIPTNNNASTSDSPLTFLLSNGKCQANGTAAEWSLTGATRAYLCRRSSGSAGVGGGVVMVAFEKQPWQARHPDSASSQPQTHLSRPHQSGCRSDPGKRHQARRDRSCRPGDRGAVAPSRPEPCLHHCRRPIRRRLGACARSKDELSNAD
jgi:hypothetical protein